jgi:hypothetical protein
MYLHAWVLRTPASWRQSLFRGDRIRALSCKENMAQMHEHRFTGAVFVSAHFALVVLTG